MAAATVRTLFKTPEDFTKTHSGIAKVQSNICGDAEAMLRFLKLSETIFQLMQLHGGNNRWLKCKRFANIGRIPMQLVVRFGKAWDYTLNPKKNEAYWDLRIFLNTLGPFLFFPFGGLFPFIKFLEKEELIEPWKGLGKVMLWGGTIGGVIAGANGLVGGANDREIAERLERALQHLPIRVDIHGRQLFDIEEDDRQHHEDFSLLHSPLGVQARAIKDPDTPNAYTSLVREKAIRAGKNPDTAEKKLEGEIADCRQGSFYDAEGGCKYLIEVCTNLMKQFGWERLFGLTGDAKLWAANLADLIPRCVGVHQSITKHRAAQEKNKRRDELKALPE